MREGTGEIAMRTGLVLVCTAFLALGAEVNREASLSAARKFQSIAEGSLVSGASVELLQDEMNAFVEFHAEERIPEGIEDPEIEFREGGAVIRARVDLEKAGASSDALPPLMRLLLRGSRSVALDVDYAARDGYAAAQLVSMTVEEVELGGPVLEWFLESFAPPEWRPYLLGEKIKLEGGVREIRLEAGRAVIVIE